MKELIAPVFWGNGLFLCRNRAEAVWKQRPRLFLLYQKFNAAAVRALALAGKGPTHPSTYGGISMKRILTNHSTSGMIITSVCTTPYLFIKGV